MIRMSSRQGSLLCKNSQLPGLKYLLHHQEKEKASLTLSGYYAHLYYSKTEMEEIQAKVMLTSVVLPNVGQRGRERSHVGLASCLPCNELKWGSNPPLKKQERPQKQIFLHLWREKKILSSEVVSYLLVPFNLGVLGADGGQPSDGLKFYKY